MLRPAPWEGNAPSLASPDTGLELSDGVSARGGVRVIQHVILIPLPGDLHLVNARGGRAKGEAGMKFRLFVVIASGAFSAPGLAADRTALQTEDIVVTATRFEERSADQPIGVQVVTREQIRGSGASSLVELLGKQAGVYVRDINGDPNRQVDLRGFGITGDQNTLVLIDGQRVSENEIVPANLSAVPIESIERIEIMRGSGAVLYGGGATGGTINVITRGAQPASAEAQLRAGYGTYHTWEAAAGGRIAGDDAGLSLSASQLQSDSYRENNSVRQRNFQADLRFFAVNGPVYIKLGTASQDLRFPGSRTEAQLLADRQGTATPDDFGELRATRVVLGTSQTVDAGELAVDFGYRERDSFSANQPGSSDIDGSVTSFSPRMKVPFSAAGSHFLVAGLDWDAWDYSSTVLFPGFTSRSASDQENVAVFIKDTIELTPSTRLSLGGRLQRSDTTITDISGGTPALTQVRRPKAWELALRQAASASVSVFAKTGQSFRLANVDDNRAVMNPLEPQTSHDAEIGVDIVGERTSLRAAFYQMRLRNEIQFLPGDVLPPFGANVNLPPTRRRGVEIEGGWAITEALSVSGTYVLSAATYREGSFGGADVTGKTIPLVPRHRASASAAWQITPNARASATLSYVGEQYYDNDQSNSFGRKIPDYTVTDLAAALDTGRWTVSAIVRNLFGEKYYTYAIRSVTAPTFNAYPAPERSFFLSAEYQFGPRR